MLMNNNAPICIFDIETIPDTTTGKLLYPELADLSEEETIVQLQKIRQEEAGNDFMRLPLHKIACLSFLWFENNKLKLHSLSLENQDEQGILNTFLRAFNKKPTLISWNGAGFDLPVLLYRMAHHKLNGSALLQGNNSSKGYLNRYSQSHIDLMQKFSFEAWGNKQKLDTIASLCGFAGKGEVDGNQVVPMVLAQKWQELTTYCESDVINTWLIYIRYQLLMGEIDAQTADNAVNFTKNYLQILTDADGNPRHARFL